MGLRPSASSGRNWRQGQPWMQVVVGGSGPGARCWWWPPQFPREVNRAGLELLIVPTPWVAAGGGPAPQEGLQLICSLLLLAAGWPPFPSSPLFALLLALALLVFALLLRRLFFFLGRDLRVKGAAWGWASPLPDPCTASTSFPFFFFFFFSLEATLPSFSA